MTLRSAYHGCKINLDNNVFRLVALVVKSKLKMTLELKWQIQEPPSVIKLLSSISLNFMKKLRPLY